MVGLNEHVELDFMRVGHTLCFIDAGFWTCQANTTTEILTQSPT